ncbi:MAG: dockerin type I domain-containing protein, partial [Bacteroidia bacterium]|nr:dockerin type I domain-containing protein [Bacteroidia bacterium]
GHGGTPVRLLSPVYCPSQTTDTLYSEVPLSLTTGGYAPLVPPNTRVRVHLPQRSQGLIDTSGILHTPSCTDNSDAFSARFWTYRIPLLTISVRAPDTVCEGQRFYSIFSADSTIYESECSLLPSTIGKQGNVISNPTSEGEGIFLWAALRAGYDTIFVSIPSRYSCFVQPNPLRHPIRVRQAHRLHLQAFPEGLFVPGPDTLKANLVLSYRNLIRYAMGVSGITSDSLWRLPVRKGESHWRVWLGAPYAHLASCVTAPTPIGSVACRPYDNNFVSTIALVELYETLGGPRVDSAYIVIDKNGRAYPFLAGAYNWGAIPYQFDQDTLHFCMCDLSQSKWVVVRFPHHLPLRSPQALNLPTSGPPLTLDLRDPGNLAGIPNVHYRIMNSTSRSYAAAWAGNCADTYNSFLAPPVHYDTGVINAADWEFMRHRIGVVGSSSSPALSWADLNNDGVVNALDATILIENQNQLHRSARRGR